MVVLFWALQLSCNSLSFKGFTFWCDFYKTITLCFIKNRPQCSEIKCLCGCCNALLLEPVRITMNEPGIDILEFRIVGRKKVAETGLETRETIRSTVTSFRLKILF